MFNILESYQTTMEPALTTLDRFQQLPMFTPSGKRLRCSATNTNQDSTRHRLCRPLEGYICGITQCSKVLGHTGTDRAHTARDKAKNVTPEEHELGLQRFHVYREWLLKEVLRVHERNPILVWPIKVVEPNYRDEVPKKCVHIHATHCHRRMREVTQLTVC